MLILQKENILNNQERHIELLKRSEYFKNQGKSFYHESPDEYSELSSYQGSIESYIYWKRRREFLLLMEKFVNRIITGEEFDDSFLGLRQRLITESEDCIKEFIIKPRLALL